ncbi:MAG: cold shock domain-containing protein [Pirellulales bacterium]|nr:cold shock domain-containing protein [Pirellulales bacterium]
MPQGVIKKLVTERGFGFLSGEHDDVFFHHSAVVEQRFEDLREGQTVEYVLEEEAAAVQGAGPRAVSVRPA